MSSNLKIKRICAWCGKEFIAQKTTTACCSKQCANALYKKNKKQTISYNHRNGNLSRSNPTNRLRLH